MKGSLRYLPALLVVAVVALIPGAAPGKDASMAEAGEVPFLCIDPFGSFDPLALGGGCFPGVEPHVDAVSIIGRTILEDDYAPPGTVVESFVNGQECGVTTVPDGSVFRTFELRVLGAGERAGCAGPGDLVEFRVGGVLAAETYSWIPFSSVSEVSGPLQIQHLVAMEEHAWYWFERRGGELPADTINVRSLVDGVECGGAGIRFARGGIAVVGFSRLIVPSGEIQSGCGEPGATVSFVVSDVEAQNTVSWEPGLQRIDLALSGDVNCDFRLNSIDAALVLQFDAGLSTSLACQDAADVNGDGRINAVDAALILQFHAGLIDSLARSPAAS